MILIISGSPKKNSNSNQLAEYLKNKYQKEKIEVNVIKLSDQIILPCIDCGACRNTLNCPRKDDFSNLLPLFQSAKIIIVISPVYFGNVPSQLKALFDRSVMLRRNSFLLEHKFGAGIVIGGSRNGGQEFTLSAIHNWFHIHGMFSFPDSKPSSHFGSILTARNPGEVFSDDLGMETVIGLTNNIDYLLTNYLHVQK